MCIWLWNLEKVFLKEYSVGNIESGGSVVPSLLSPWCLAFIHPHWTPCLPMPKGVGDELCTVNSVQFGVFLRGFSFSFRILYPVSAVVNILH